jgi:hypothetical protein
MAKEIEPTAQDWEAVHRSLENPRQALMETLARIEARRRVEREQRERRLRLLRRFLPFRRSA